MEAFGHAFAKEKQEMDAAPVVRGRPAELFIPNPKLRLREQLREVMRFLHYSVRTEESYRLWILRFILLHNKRHPREVGSAEVHAFLTDPATHHRVAVATLANPRGEPAQDDMRGTN